MLKGRVIILSGDYIRSGWLESLVVQDMGAVTSGFMHRACIPGAGIFGF